MGGCALANKERLRNRHQSVLELNWMKISGCVDKFTFMQRLNNDIYEENQLDLASRCLEFKIISLSKNSLAYN